MKINVRRVNGSLRLELDAETVSEAAGLSKFIDALNGGTIKEDEDNIAFDRALRVESVGIGIEALNSIAIETAHGWPFKDVP